MVADGFNGGKRWVRDTWTALREPTTAGWLEILDEHLLVEQRKAQVERDAELAASLAEPGWQWSDALGSWVSRVSTASGMLARLNSVRLFPERRPAYS
jgi:hypothetical protein